MLKQYPPPWCPLDPVRERDTRAHRRPVPAASSDNESNPPLLLKERPSKGFSVFGSLCSSECLTTSNLRSYKGQGPPAREEGLVKRGSSVAAEIVLRVSSAMAGQKRWRKGDARGCLNEGPTKVRRLNRDELKSWSRGWCLAKRGIRASVAHNACLKWRVHIVDAASRKGTSRTLE